MKNLDKKTIIIVLVSIGILLIIVSVFLSRPFCSIDDNFPQRTGQNMSIIENKYMIEGNKDDLVSLSIWPDTKVSGIRSFRGSVKGGYFFEGNILINILDSNKNVLRNSNAMATTEWMTADPVEFEGYIDFTTLPKGPAYFEIHNDNASGLPENDKSILIPIIIS